jgi:tetratricopeptide (TPR) repeat protein
MYSWRVNAAKTPGDQQRMIKEADFAHRQAFVLGPYGPETVYRYVKLLADVGRFEDALRVGQTALRLDPLNPLTVQLVEQLRQFGGNAQQFRTARQQLQRLEEQYRLNPHALSNALALAQAYLDNQLFSQATQVLGQVVTDLEPQWQADPTNATLGSYLAASYLQLRQPLRARVILNQVIELPNVDPNTLIAAAQTYAALSDATHLEKTLGRLVQVSPESPEAWYDYAALLASINKPTEAFHSLSNALRLSAARLAQQPKARDLKTAALADSRFGALRTREEWRRLTGQGGP